MAWLEQCRIVFRANATHHIVDGLGVRATLRELSRESGIPFSTLNKWYYNVGNKNSKLGGSENGPMLENPTPLTESQEASSKGEPTIHKTHINAQKRKTGRPGGLKTPSLRHQASVSVEETKFMEAYAALLEIIESAKMSEWKTISKTVILKHLEVLNITTAT